MLYNYIDLPWYFKSETFWDNQGFLFIKIPACHWKKVCIRCLCRSENVKPSYLCM